MSDIPFRPAFSVLLLMTASAVAMADQAATKNRLASESSPYLLLHAHNPVDWYPWGPEAFEKAKKEDKLIFLSVGYSSCYWCHVMERKVFSNEAIAKYMNEHFVNIKVDREERPDVDDVYMTSLLVYNQLIKSGKGGGWPLSMFLTPDGNPIGGATYIPPTDSPNTGLGFQGIAERLTAMWQEQRDAVDRTATLIAGEVNRMMKPGPALEQTELAGGLLTAAVEQVRSMYDPVWGGVDFDADRPMDPRFPNVPRLEMALDVYESGGDETLLKMVEHSLLRMAHGGIRDHLGGGFHRYSTDRRWHVPHFEKMLYDQAMLLGIYTRTAALTQNAEFQAVAAEIADFVHREMTTPEGGFCSALDAETNAIEGEYYVWSKKELNQILGEDEGRIFSEVYGINAPNPFEHGYVLHLPAKLSDAARTFNLPVEQLTAELAPMKDKVLAARSKRERPLLDDKVLTSWNALMLRALAFNGKAFSRPQDIAAAEKAADFLLSNLMDDQGQLLRTWRQGQAKYAAYLDDYAFLVDGLLELHAATQNAKWLDHARKLAVKQNELFYDEQLQAFYFTASNHEKLIARTSSAYDSVFPSANSVSVRNLLRLNALEQSPELESIAVSTLTRFAPTLQKSPAACAGMARALHLWLSLSDESSAMYEQSIAARGWQLARLVDSDEVVGASNPAPPIEPVIERSAFKPIIQADPDDPFVKDDKQRPVKMKIYPIYDKLERGGKCLVAIELQVQDGWHINANPANPDFLVPTKIEVKSKQKVKLTRVKYPEHHKLKVDGFDQPYHVYDGKVMIYGLLEIDKAEVADAATLEFHLRFQGCNSKECLPPDTIAMKGKLPVVPQGTPLKKVNESKFPKPKPKPKTGAAAPE